MAAPPTPIYGAYATQIGDEKSHSTNVGGSISGSTQRKWRVPPSPTLIPPTDPIPCPWDMDPQNICGIWVPFQREEMNRDYPELIHNDDGRIADVMALKLQADHLSSQERAYRIRHASHIRSAMHAANRRSGGGGSGGVHDRMTDHVIDVITSRSAGD